jgi:hypothetical protein
MMNLNIKRDCDIGPYGEYYHEFWNVMDGKRKLCSCDNEEDAEMIKTALELYDA